MNTDIDEFATRLATQLHDTLDTIPLDDVAWRDARQAGSARVTARRRRALVPAIALAAAIAAAATTLVTVHFSPNKPDGTLTTSRAWRVVATAKLGSGTTPPFIAAGDGFLFAGLWDTGTVVRLDPVTLEQTGALKVGSKDDGPLSIAFGGGALWVLNFSDGRLWRIDPSTMQVSLKVPVAAEPSRVAFGDGSVWVTVCCGANKATGRQRLERIDPATGHVTGSVTLAGEGEGIPLAAGASIVVASQSSPVYVIDPTTLAVEHRLPGDSVPGLAVLGNGVYIAGLNAVSRFDATTGLRTATSPDLTADETNESLTSGVDGLWLGVDGALVELDPVTLRVTTRVSVDTVTHVVDAHPWIYVSRPGELLRLSRQESDASAARAMCETALGGGVSSVALTSLGIIRTINIGGPPPGVVPGKNAFPGHDASEPAAWCWKQTSASPGDTGQTWSWYAVIDGAPPTRLFTESGLAKSPTSPPSVP